MREQQAATNEVLLAVGRPDFELQPIFETVVEQAIRLCQADAGQMLVSQRVHAGVEDLVLSTEVRDLQLKGFSRPVSAYEIVGLNAAQART